MKEKSEHPELAKSEIVEALPLACADEDAAVEFLEAQRWGKTPKCPHCESADVYKMLDRDGTRNKRYLWRCRGCGNQYTVRLGAVYEESRIPLKHWCYAYWRACSSKKGVAAREIQRHCQINYRSALFLMHRIRFAMTPDPKSLLLLKGIVECDESYVGGRPRPGTGPQKRGRAKGESYPTEVTNTVEYEFNELAEKWYAETGMLSFVRQKALNPAYQMIIGMGKDALPFIFRELSTRGGDWLWALEAINRTENPAAGITNFRAAVAAWLEWGRARGYIAS